MPTKPLRPCSHPGCAELVSQGSRCQRHQRQLYKTKTAVALSDASKADDKRFYDSALWKKIRAQILREEPWCRTCAAEGRPTLATMVDHQVQISKGGSRTDRANLCPMCATCHAAKRWKESQDAKGR